MEPDLTQSAINEIPEVQPVQLPDPSLTVPERLDRLEEELNSMQ